MKISLKLIAVVIGGAAVALLFQNCSGVQFDSAGNISQAPKADAGFEFDDTTGTVTQPSVPVSQPHQPAPTPQPPSPPPSPYAGITTRDPSIPLPTPPAPPAGTGKYEGYLWGTQPHRFILTNGISGKEALDNCLLNARQNQSYHIRCFFNGVRFYDSK